MGVDAWGRLANCIMRMGGAKEVAGDMWCWKGDMKGVDTTEERPHNRKGETHIRPLDKQTPVYNTHPQSHSRTPNSPGCTPSPRHHSSRPRDNTPRARAPYPLPRHTSPPPHSNCSGTQSPRSCPSPRGRPTASFQEAPGRSGVSTPLLCPPHLQTPTREGRQTQAAPPARPMHSPSAGPHLTQHAHHGL